MEPKGVRAEVQKAFDALAADFAARGGQHFAGYLDADDGHGYIGTFAWSEMDIQHRLATKLEERFPQDTVHIGLPLRAGTREGVAAEDGQAKWRVTHVDVVVSDMSSLSRAEQARDFRTRTHEAFIEVKWFHQASKRWSGIGRRDFRNGVSADIRRQWLHRIAAPPLCAYAAVLAVDDSGLLVDDAKELLLAPQRAGKPPAVQREWLDEVDVVVLGPGGLRRLA